MRFSSAEAADSETGYIRRIEAATGLRRERFLSEFTTPVTAEDVAQAPRADCLDACECQTQDS